MPDSTGAANLFCRMLDMNSVNMRQLAPPACESDSLPNKIHKTVEKQEQLCGLKTLCSLVRGERYFLDCKLNLTNLTIQTNKLQ